MPLNFLFLVEKLFWGRVLHKHKAKLDIYQGYMRFGNFIKEHFNKYHCFPQVSIYKNLLLAFSRNFLKLKFTNPLLLLGVLLVIWQISQFAKSFLFWNSFINYFKDLRERRKAKSLLKWMPCFACWSPFPLERLVLISNVIISDLQWGCHSVLEQIWIKGSYIDQRLLQHESLYPIGLKSARIKVPYIGSNYIDFSKTDFY